jgi:hypothetical protein
MAVTDFVARFINERIAAPSKSGDQKQRPSSAPSMS